MSTQKYVKDVVNRTSFWSTPYIFTVGRKRRNFKVTILLYPSSRCDTDSGEQRSRRLGELVDVKSFIGNSLDDSSGLRWIRVCWEHVPLATLPRYSPAVFLLSYKVCTKTPLKGGGIIATNCARVPLKQVHKQRNQRPAAKSLIIVLMLL